LIRVRLLSQGQTGPWREFKVVVLAPLPPLPKTDTRHLGIFLWPSKFLPAPLPVHKPIVESLLTEYRTTGVRRIHVHEGQNVAALIRMAQRVGIHVNLRQWWGYQRQCPPNVVPTESEKATDADPRWTQFCPEVMAEGIGTYGSFLQTIPEKLIASGVDGLMLDYESKVPLCYCDRCKVAFIKHTRIGRRDHDLADGRY